MDQLLKEVDKKKSKMTALSAMLDELMGRDRNAAPNEKRTEVRWEDDDVSLYIKQTHAAFF